MTKESTKKLLIKFQLLLGLEFESDNMIKSKTIKYIANYLIMGKVIPILQKQHLMNIIKCDNILMLQMFILFSQL